MVFLFVPERRSLYLHRSVSVGESGVDKSAQTGISSFNYYVLQPCALLNYTICHTKHQGKMADVGDKRKKKKRSHLGIMLCSLG